MQKTILVMHCCRCDLFLFEHRCRAISSFVIPRSCSLIRDSHIYNERCKVVLDESWRGAQGSSKVELSSFCLRHGTRHGASHFNL